MKEKEKSEVKPEEARDDDEVDKQSEGEETLETKSNYSWLPDGDILIHTGDFTVSGQANEVKDFIKFLDAVPHKHKIVVAGNHDICLEPEWYCTNNNWFSFHPKV